MGREESRGGAKCAEKFRVLALALGFSLNEVGVMSSCRAKNTTKVLH